MRLNFICESDLEFKNVLNILPSKYQKAFRKAWEWEPKTKNLDIDTTIQLVLNRQKPIGYGYKESILSEISDKFNLEHDLYSFFYDENRDIADLISFTIGRFEIRSPFRHFIIGICCGYDHDDVVKFSNAYINPNDELKRGLNNHDNGLIIR